MPEYTLQVKKTKPLELSTPTTKALAYKAALKKELAGKNVKPKRRAEIEEDFAKIEKAHYVKINGTIHYVLDEGPTTGESVILVHGWDCSSMWWHNVTPPLNEAGYRTINYDMRGHGFSDDNVAGDDDYGILRFVEDLESLRVYLGLEKFHLAAFSLGSVIVTAYAARYPEHVASTCVFNFGLWGYSPLMERVMPTVLSTLFSRILRPIGPRSWRFVYGYARLVLTKNSVDKRDILYGLLGLEGCPARTTYNACRSIMSKEILGTLPQWATMIQAPTLLVAGSNDNVIPRRTSDAMAKLIPNITYFVMPKCGHLILAELPHQVTELMKMHIARAAIKTPELTVS